MDQLALVGVHFSSVKPPNPTWIAWGVERGGALVLEGVEHVGVTLPERLARHTPRVLALDAPFGVPLAFARSLVNLVTNGSQILEHLAVANPAELDAAWATFATEHPGALRLTEAITHGAPSVTTPRPPLWRTTRALAKLLWSLRDRVAVLPFDALELTPTRSMVLETLPGATLRILGLPYARYRESPDLPLPESVGTATRLAIVKGLGPALAPLGVRIDVHNTVADGCAADHGGDALDAVLSCVTAHLATRGLWSPPPLAGHNAVRAQVEGWIVRPG